MFGIRLVPYAEGGLIGLRRVSNDNDLIQGRHPRQLS